MVHEGGETPTQDADAEDDDDGGDDDDVLAGEEVGVEGAARVHEGLSTEGGTLRSGKGGLGRAGDQCDSPDGVVDEEDDGGGDEEVAEDLVPLHLRLQFHSLQAQKGPGGRLGTQESRGKRPGASLVLSRR